jgi:alkanesulfonate monooxygenase SsuD/methylene tetrahydromethanopterin reductase-like flavin-dependent oxidoreductase (luciferase family)
VSEDGRTARDRLRRGLAFVLRGPHHAANLAQAGTSLDQVALTRAFAAEDWVAVDDLIGDQVLNNHSASGTPEQVRVAMRAYGAIGLDEIGLAGVGNPEDLRSMLDAAMSDGPRGRRRCPG